MTDLNSAAVGQDVSLRPELVDVVPDTRVPPECMRVDEHTSLGGDVVAEQLSRPGRLVWDEEGARRVHSEGFPDDTSEVVEVDQVGLGDHALGADDRVEFFLYLAHDSWMLDHLGHGRLAGHGGSVCCRSYHVLPNAKTITLCHTLIKQCK